MTLTVHALIVSDGVNAVPLVWLFADPRDAERAATKLLATRVQSDPEIDPGDAAEIVRLARVGASDGTHQLYIALALYYEITDGAAIILREIDVVPAGETPLALGKLIGGGGA